MNNRLIVLFTIKLFSVNNDTEDIYLKSMRENLSLDDQAKTFYEILRMKRAEIRSLKKVCIFFLAQNINRPLSNYNQSQKGKNHKIKMQSFPQEPPVE